MLIQFSENKTTYAIAASTLNVLKNNKKLGRTSFLYNMIRKYSKRYFHILVKLFLCV